MGLAVTGLGLFGLGVVVCVLDLATVVECVTGFGLGASSMALFGRVGGGIYTKAADVGADLVGKVEAGIPEDDQFLIDTMITAQCEITENVLSQLIFFKIKRYSVFFNSYHIYMSLQHNSRMIFIA